MIDAGIELWELQDHVIEKIGKYAKSRETLGLHTKMLVIDNDLSIIGSQT